MFTVKDIPGERKCQKNLHMLVFGTKRCPLCDNALRYTPAYAWCKQCRRKVSARAATWLKYSKLPYRTLFVLVFAWQQRSTPGDTVKLVGLSYPTVERWFSRFRQYLPEDLAVLGGEVEMDEAFFGKRKHHHQTIVLGARERKGSIRLRVAPERDEREIELFLMEHIQTDTKLFTDAYSSYHNVSWYGYAHEVCNHSAGHFAGTARIENVWSRCKRHIQKLYGKFHLPYLKGLLREWEARHNFPELFETPENYFRECLVPV
jgi:transposase-like protein